MSDLISRAAAIRKYQEVCNGIKCGECPFLIKVNTEKGSHVITDCKLEAFLHNLPSAQPKQQWIPCSERLPIAKHKTYWICTDTGHQCECRWTNVNHFWTNLTTEWHWHIMDIPQYSKVIAWMPLPEPAKLGGD